MLFVRGNLTFDAATNILQAEKRTTASPKQARILKTLMAVSHPVSRDLLIDRLMARSPDSCLDSVLDVQIHRLRKKLRSIGATAQIKCIWGCGFIIEPAAEESAFLNVSVKLFHRAVELALLHDVGLAEQLKQVEG